MTGTNCDLFTHNQSLSYLNHLVLHPNCFPRVHLCLPFRQTTNHCACPVTFSRTSTCADSLWRVYGDAGISAAYVCLKKKKKTFLRTFDAQNKVPVNLSDGKVCIIISVFPQKGRSETDSGTQITKSEVQSKPCVLQVAALNTPSSERHGDLVQLSPVSNCWSWKNNSDRTSTCHDLSGSKSLQASCSPRHR
jgi:hypothetical protein